jgi:hypothetical protein
MHIQMAIDKRRQFRPLVAIASLSLALAVPTVEAATTGIGPLPYLSAADSPFLSDPSLVTILEDFEDGALNAPGIVNDEMIDYRFPPIGNDGHGRVVEPGAETDSVDGDDAAIDGSGAGGHSYRSMHFIDTVADGNIYNNLLFSFPDRKPVAVGFVWTDGQPALLEFVVRELNQIEYKSFVFAPLLGDGDGNGGTSEDRFIGVYSSVGIEAFGMSSIDPNQIPGTDDGRRYFEIDHLQFSYPVPEPDAILAAPLLLALARMRHRRRTRWPAILRLNLGRITQILQPRRVLSFAKQEP